MTEVLHTPATSAESRAVTPEQEALAREHQASLDKAATFLDDQIPALCRLTGMDVRVAIGDGWATATQKLVRSPLTHHSSLKKAIQLTTVCLLLCMS